MEKKYLYVPFVLEETKEIVKENQKFGIIKGYASTFGNVDKGQDRVMKGAFTDTLEKFSAKNRQIRMFSQHGYGTPIGGFPVYKETRKGLAVEGNINLEVQRGFETYSLAKQGVMTDFSIGYWTIEADWVTEKVGEKDGNDITMEIRNLKKLDIDEISVVSSPMNEDAIVSGVKSCKTITDVTKLLKSFGITQNEVNGIVYFIKSLSRNESEDLNEKTRNELIDKLDRINLGSKLDNVLSNLKKGM